MVGGAVAINTGTTNVAGSEPEIDLDEYKATISSATPMP